MKTLKQVINEKLKITKDSYVPKYEFELTYVKPWTHDHMKKLIEGIWKDDDILFTLKENESKMKSNVICNSDDGIKQVFSLIKAIWQPSGFYYPLTGSYIMTYFWEFYVDDYNIIEVIKQHIKEITTLSENLPENFDEIYNKIKK